MIGFIVCCLIIIGLFLLGAFIMQWFWDRWYYGGGFIFLWFMIWNLTSYLLQQNLGWLIQVILKIILRMIGIPVF